MIKKVLTVAGVVIVASVVAVKCYKKHKHSEYVEYIEKIRTEGFVGDAVTNSRLFINHIFSNYKKHGLELNADYMKEIDDKFKDFCDGELNQVELKDELVKLCLQALQIVENNL